MAKTRKNYGLTFPKGFEQYRKPFEDLYKAAGLDAATFLRNLVIEQLSRENQTEPNKTSDTDEILAAIADLKSEIQSQNQNDRFQNPKPNHPPINQDLHIRFDRLTSITTDLLAALAELKAENQNRHHPPINQDLHIRFDRLIDTTSAILTIIEQMAWEKA